MKEGRESLGEHDDTERERKNFKSYVLPNQVTPIMLKYIFQIVTTLLITFIEVKSDKTLLSVNLLFRHGDRTPIRPYPNDPHKVTNSSVFAKQIWQYDFTCLLIPSNSVDWADVSQIGWALLWQVRVTQVSSLSASPITAVAQPMKHQLNLDFDSIRIIKSSSSAQIATEVNKSQKVKQQNCQNQYIIPLAGVT